MTPWFWTAQVLVQAILTVAGLVLLLRAAVGRLALAGPRCVGCGHDLRGTGQPPQKCAECGAELSRPDAVSFAVRVRSARLALLGGGTIALAATLPLAVLAVERIVGARDGTSSQVAVTAPPPPSLAELVEGFATSKDPDRLRRLAFATLQSMPSKEEATAILRILEEAAAAAGGELPPEGHLLWSQALARLDLFVPVEERPAIAKLAGGRLVAAIPEILRVGEPWAILVHASPPRDVGMRTRGVAGVSSLVTPYLAVLRLEEVRVDGLPVDLRRSGPASVSAGATVRVEMAPLKSQGPVELEVVVRRELLGRDDLPIAGLPHDPSLWPRPVAEERQVIQRTLEVVAPGQPLVNRVQDPALESQMGGVLSVISCTLRGSGAARRLEVEARLVPPGGVWIAGRWRVRVDGRWHDGPLIAAWGKPDNSAVNGPLAWSVPLPEGPEPAFVDVAIEPIDNEPSILPRDGTRIWGSPIEFRGVPVRRE